MKVGDLVRVTKQCGAGGLWEMTGIVVELSVPPQLRRRCPPSKPSLARVLLPIRLSLIQIEHLEVISAVV